MSCESGILSSILFSQTSDWNIKHFFNANTVRSSFELKRIGSVLKRRKDQMTVSDEQWYKRITIRTNCSGVVVRDEVLGKEIKTKKQYYVRAGQLAVSKIDARNGAFGMIPAEADGAIITGNFWVYDVDLESADIDYLILLLSSDVFVQTWQDCSNGSGNRLYLQEAKFLDCRIPLPAPSIQNEIVSSYYRLIRKSDFYLSKAAKLEDHIDDYLLKNLAIKKTQGTKTNGSGLITTARFKTLVGWGAKLNSNPVKPQDLFRSARYPNAPIEEFCAINPKTVVPREVSTISFVPMECVSDIYGEIVEKREGDASRRKGYTLFQENDVIWAKITPCMQNGKSAVAKKLINGFGCGSTEFHVFRANHNALPEYIHCFLRSKQLRKAATFYFTGGAGQQRVGTDFLEALTIPKIPVRSDNPNEMTQEKLVHHVAEMKRQIKALHRDAEDLRERAKREFEEAVFSE